METDNTLSTAAQQYAKANAVHYAQRDLLAALQSYGEVIALNPGMPELGYSHTQILGIVNQVVPAEELRAAQTALALNHLQPEGDAAATANRS